MSILLPFIFEDSSSCPTTSRRCPSSMESQDIFPFDLSNGIRALHQLRNKLAGELEKDNTITVNKERFQASVDVQQFKPEEISVKLTDDFIVTVEGKHEEKQDEHGFISRHFVRRFVIPEDCDVNQLKSTLSSDGVLSVVAPKKPQGEQMNHKEIPIIRTGKPIEHEKQKDGRDAEKKS